MDARSVESARAQFVELARRPDRDLDLCEAALWIAAESSAPVDVGAALGQIDTLAEDAAQALPRSDTVARAHALVSFLHDERGFRGNAAEYYDPRNSFLHEVLERRLGIPITLSILWVGVANRLGMPSAGVTFPGHFLARTIDSETVVDAFHGRVVGPEECAELLRQSAGAEARFDARLLAPAPPRRVLGRMLSNLKQIYIRDRAWDDALRCSDRILLLLPDEALELRDRGLLHRALECFRPALQDLEAFVALAPESQEARALHPVIAELRTRATRLN